MKYKLIGTLLYVFFVINPTTKSPIYVGVLGVDGISTNY